MNVFIILGLATLTFALKEDAVTINKRVLPTNKNCNPDSGMCRKGDWVDRSIADCEYDRSFLHPLSCDAQNDVPWSWTVDVAQGDRCIPSSSGKRFTCGAQGTNTRCVCSDTNIFYNPGPNECRCQYWPPEDVGAQSPAFCTGHYVGGSSSPGIGSNLHHWACCNNCNNPNGNTCDARTWQGGSSTSYCSSCGMSTSTGGGRVKYYFNCGSCDDQRACASRCDSYDFPTLCWKWLDCFKGCCLTTTSQPRNQKRDISERSFCGDSICAGTETPASCPGDCCYQMNSGNCTSGNSCSPECCYSPNCCLDSENSATVIAIPIGFIFFFLYIFAVVFY